MELEMWQLPKQKTSVGYKLVFTIKHKINGTIKRFKVCLITKEFTQTYKIDYIETFTLVAKTNTI